MPTILPIANPDVMKNPTKRTVQPLVPEGLFSALSKVQWVDLRVLAGVPKVEVELPSGETFLLTADGLIFVLGELDVWNPESVADYAWNFKETTFDLQTGTIRCTYELNRRIGKP